MASSLMTSEDMIKELSLRVRVAARDAKECSDHLAIHSTNSNAVILYNAHVALNQIADELRRVIISVTK